jgi:hypothetical protein
MSWTTPDALVEQVLKVWNRGDILRARLAGEALFPLDLKLKRPSPREVAERFGEVQDWARALAAASRDVRGFGFEVKHEALRNRVQGLNDLAVAAVVPTESDALRLIRKQTDAERFKELSDATLGRYPALREWLVRRPLAALSYADVWPRVLGVLDWFVAHPRSGLYLRQLDIPGVDTKFIESQRGLISELLDSVLPDNAIDSAVSGSKAFSQRYGLRTDPPLLRFRLLDASLYLNGLSDLSLTPAEFGTLRLPVRRVFVTENRTNGIAFPDHPNSMVIFGLGYGLERFAETPWLRDPDVWYWGDIDTHGFRILDRLRAVLPAARSLLMDRATLDAHRSLWGDEPAAKRFTGDLSRLSAEEQSLFDDLRHDRVGERVRLEQERIGYNWLARTLAALPEPEVPEAKTNSSLEAM